MSQARDRFEAAKEFSISFNTHFWQEIRRIGKERRKDTADQLLSLIHTFGLLVVVWAYEAFLTERCQELAQRLAEPLAEKHGKPLPAEESSPRRNLRCLGPQCRTPDDWETYVNHHYKPEMYFKARHL